MSTFSSWTFSIEGPAKPINSLKHTLRAFLCLLIRSAGVTGLAGSSTSGTVPPKRGMTNNTGGQVSVSCSPRSHLSEELAYWHGEPEARFLSKRPPALRRSEKVNVSFPWRSQHGCSCPSIRRQSGYLTIVKAVIIEYDLQRGKKNRLPRVGFRLLYIRAWQ